MTTDGRNSRYDVALLGSEGSGTAGFGEAFRAALTFLAGVTNPNTAEAYRRDLLGCGYKPGECRHTEPDQHNQLAWFHWCLREGVNPLTAGRDDLREWLADLADDGQSGSTQARRLGAVSAWYADLLASDKIDVNPVSRLRPKERPKRRTPGTAGTALSDAQALDLLAAADADGPRSAAIVATAIYSGMRVSEVVHLNIESYTVADEGPMLTYVGKGSKTIQTPIPPVVSDRIDAWLAVRRDTNRLPVPVQHRPRIRPDRPLFVTVDGDRLSRQTLYRLVRRLAEAAGIPTPVSPHDLRRTHISQAIKEGVPIRDVQKSVGHANSSTTEGYDRSHLERDRQTSYRLAARHAKIVADPREDEHHAA